MEYLSKSADISSDGVYRYALARRLATGDRAVLFVGLNPSTADASLDDPTIRRCVGFAKDWGFDWLLMGNIYAFRSADPKAIYQDKDPVGPRNFQTLREMAFHSELVVAAWGRNKIVGQAWPIADWVVHHNKVKCLGQNKDRTPKHPLYLAAKTELVELTNAKSK